MIHVVKTVGAGPLWYWREAVTGSSPLAAGWDLDGAQAQDFPDRFTAAAVQLRQSETEGPAQDQRIFIREPEATFFAVLHPGGGVLE